MKELIQTADLRKQLESANPPILIDVRLEDDFKTAHIPGAISNCVYEVAFAERLVNLAPDQTRPTVLYGATSGSYEARIAAEKLCSAGYANVYEYRDGLEAWQTAGAPVNQCQLPLAEPVIFDGIRPVDVADSSVEWSGRNLLKKHHGRIGLHRGHRP